MRLAHLPRRGLAGRIDPGRVPRPSVPGASHRTIRIVELFRGCANSIVRGPGLEATGQSDPRIDRPCRQHGPDAA